MSKTPRRTRRRTLPFKRPAGTRATLLALLSPLFLSSPVACDLSRVSHAMPDFSGKRGLTLWISPFLASINIPKSRGRILFHRTEPISRPDRKEKRKSQCREGIRAPAPRPSASHQPLVLRRANNKIGYFNPVRVLSASSQTLYVFKST